MQKLLAFALVAALVTPTLAVAAVPGVNLGWNNCGTTSASQNRVFTCDDNNLTFNLVASFQVATTIPDFVGVSAVVDFRVNDAGIPAWWAVTSGGCREGALGLINVGTLGGCTNPYSGANQAGGFVIEDVVTLPGSNDFRVRADWARDSPTAINNNVLTSAIVIQTSTANTVDEGFGVCAGCATAACMVFNSLELFTFSGAGQLFIEATDVRNWATYQGGDVGADVCPNGTPTQSRTWGQIKALYR